ncbi:MAG: quinone-dependent dihydroorotate dehydrogenase [Candidatus Peregrinibacteria bacterium]|nr:quinone-dependent dihydroorotate dehydrogenase [Candidatus Peregrinibacteria bacterium]
MILQNIIDFDQALLAKIESLQTDSLVKVFKMITAFGSVTAIIFFTILLLIFLLSKKEIQKFYAVGITVFGGFFTEFILKYTVLRARPPRMLIFENDPSFPSGHTTMSFVFFMLLFFTLKDRIKNKFLKVIFFAGCLTLASLVGFSRLYLHVHYPSDIAGAILIAAIWLIIGLNSAEEFIALKNDVVKFLYKHVVKRIVFLFDPELIHDLFNLFGRFLGSNFVTRLFTRAIFYYKNPMLSQKILGIKFENPVGLSAGFDKNIQLYKILPEIGFGYEEGGSITGDKSEGNPKPRLWRLKKSQGLIVYYGLNNRGADEISKRIKKDRFRFPVGISVAKTNCERTAISQEGIKDYLKGFNLTKGIGSYMTINISCPNAHGGQPFTDAESLGRLLKVIAKNRNKKPIFIKMPPDLKHSEIDTIIEVAQKYKIDGFICTNLTKDRANKKMMSKIYEKNIVGFGGISGKPVEDLSNETIKYMYKKTQGKAIIIGVGGIFSAEDAYKKIRLGASLLQMITGMIFEGPQVIGEINQGLVKLLKKDGLENISQAVGLDNK